MLPAPLLFLMHCMVSLRRRIKTLATKMVITSGNEEDRGSQEKENKEESILAMLGIIGTILNLIVIIFVYIYTTL
ncbi:protein TUNAR [Petaurus breviceps papuanus]|uniref:protein TUNAR n=1 Tax=Monodelphis domestica TaxID=13616 RepID=UPI0024E1D60E|nr:protein TUNAR [Monodelphis domestica]